MTMSVMLVDGTNAKYKLIPTSPGPILVADFEGSFDRFKGDRVFWPAAEIAQGKFPENLKSTTLVIAVVESYPDFETLVSSLHSPASPFLSFWIHSATVLSQMGEVEIARKKANVQQGFGELLNKLRPILTTIKRLTAREDVKLEVFGATAWIQANRQAPSMQGSISDWFLNTMDIVGYPSLDGVADGQLNYKMRVWAPAGTDPKANAPDEILVKHGEEIVKPNFAELNNEMSKRD
jgi:hypothetical protein